MNTPLRVRQAGRGEQHVGGPEWALEDRDGSLLAWFYVKSDALYVANTINREVAKMLTVAPENAPQEETR